MAIAEEQLMQVLTAAERPVGIKELMRLAGLNPGHQTEVKRTLRELLRKGELEKDGKRFRVPGRVKPAAPLEDEVSAPRGRATKVPAGRGREETPAHKRGPARGEVRGAARPEPRGPARGGGFAARDRVSASPGREAPRGPRREREIVERGGRGRAVGDRRQTFQQMKPVGELEGILHLHRDGFGFVHPLESDSENVYLPPPEAQRALDKDRVRVEVVRDRSGRLSGRLIDVVQRRREQVVGTYFDRGRRSYVAPSDPTMQGPIRVPPTQLARDGDLVKVTLGVGAGMVEPGEGLFGEVSGSVGRPGDPSGEVLSIVFSQGFSDEFPAEVMAEADTIPLTVSEEEARGEDRRDLRRLPLVTIDGEDARDFDDAVYAEQTARGWRLIVAIADVSHYVREGTALNTEALRRATSVYLPGRVLPMLPERLSAGICSLRPEEDRLCMVADLEIDRSGDTVHEEIYPGVMRSAARCTYNEVQAVLDGESVPHRDAFKPHFERLMAVARALNAMRVKRGAIDFDIAETRIVLGEDDLPARVERRERKDSHRLVEECMLAANEAVARFFQKVGEPSVYRFHADPDEEKLAAFAALAGAHGFHLPEGDISSRQLADFLQELTDHPEQRALNQLLLRSMMQAVYSAENVGHYGLAAEHYLHFTSPIRRYPDLLVHRQLKKRWLRGGRAMAEAQSERETAQLEEMAVQSSERERAAMQVEREVSAFYATLLMKDRVGEEFDAVVAAVTDFGFFVELVEEMVEGLVKAETLGPGFKLDPRLHQLVYPNGRRVKVGLKLRVRLESANVSRRQLDFRALQFEGEAPLASAALPSDQDDVRPRFDPERVLRRAREKVRHVQPPPDAPGMSLPVEVVEPAPVEDAGTSSSPHPGFDRLRALAAKKGLLKPGGARSEGPRGRAAPSERRPGSSEEGKRFGLQEAGAGGRRFGGPPPRDRSEGGKPGGKSQRGGKAHKGGRGAGPRGKPSGKGGGGKGRRR